MGRSEAILTADPGVASSIPARSHTFVITEKFYGHFPPSAESRRVVFSYKQKYMHEVLVGSLVKLAKEKNFVG